MNKFCGKIGYIYTEETSQSVYTEKVEEMGPYYGDILENNAKWIMTDKVDDDSNISVRISILADEYALRNYYAIKYVWYLGMKWKVTNIAPSHPRLILTVGGIYNGG